MEQTMQSSNVTELLRLLQENNMQDQARDIVELLKYVSGMEQKCDNIMEELRQVKEQLGKLDQKQGPAESVHKFTQKVEDRVTSVREQLHNVRRAIEDAAANMVNGFRRTGVSALRKTTEFLHIRKLLDGVQRNLGGAAQGAQKAVERMEAMGGELRTAGGHLRNAGRAVAGYERQQVEQRPEGRVQSAALFPMRGVRKMLSSMQAATAAAMNQVARFEQEQSRTPVQEAVSEEQENLQAGEESPAFTMTMS